MLLLRLQEHRVGGVAWNEEEPIHATHVLCAGGADELRVRLVEVPGAPRRERSEPHVVRAELEWGEDCGLAVRELFMQCQPRVGLRVFVLLRLSEQTRSKSSFGLV